jgi:hypothetical protein
VFRLMACASPSPDDHPAVPFWLQGWVRSLLDPEMVRLLTEAGPDAQIEVRLYVSRGRIRRRPAVLLNAGGHQEMVEPDEVQ